MQGTDGRGSRGEGPVEPAGEASVDAAGIGDSPPARRLLVLALLLGVLVVYVPLALVTTVVLAFDGVWWPLLVSFTGLIVLIIAVLWTWLGESRMVAAQSAAVAWLLALSATFFVPVFGSAWPDDPLSFTAIVLGGAAAASFLALGRAPGIDGRRTRVGLGVACLLLALHLAVLHPLDWFLPVGAWALAAAVFVGRAILTFPGDPAPSLVDLGAEA